MKKLLVVVVSVALFLSGCAMMSTRVDDLMLSNDLPTVVVIGGMKSSDWVFLEPLTESIPEAISIVPNRSWPLSTAVEELHRQIREEKKIKGRIILIGGSWTGLIVRGLDAKYPGMAVMVVTIGSPAGGYPRIFNSFFFGVGDENSETPLYIIAGYNTSPRRFWMASDKNDGFVDLKSALDLGKRKISGQKVLEGFGHMELFKSPIVIQVVKDWIELERTRKTLTNN